MGINYYFMAIPVYRLDEGKYYAALEAHFEIQYSGSCSEKFRKSNPDHLRECQRHHRNFYGGAWEFNEIVGYVKLYFMGSQVRGEYWSTIPKRKVKTRKKQFELKTLKLANEVEINAETSADVLSAVNEYVSACQRQLKDRHIDLREFDALKDHLDWMSLFKTANKALPAVILNVG